MTPGKVPSNAPNQYTHQACQSPEIKAGPELRAGQRGTKVDAASHRTPSKQRHGTQCGADHLRNKVTHSMLSTQLSHQPERQCNGPIDMCAAFSLPSGESVIRQPVVPNRKPVIRRRQPALGMS